MPKHTSAYLQKQVAACLSRHLKPGAHLRVGFSGGIDSVVLLHLLAQLAPLFLLKLSAVYVHHGLNPRADDWAEFCQAFCTRLNIPCEVVQVKVARKSAVGLEASARRARYAALCRPGSDAVALAHHLDDQAETVLFQLLRGESTVRRNRASYIMWVPAVQPQCLGGNALSSGRREAPAPGSIIGRRAAVPPRALSDPIRATG